MISSTCSSEKSSDSKDVRQIVPDRDKLFESQARKEWAHRFKMEMHQTVANRRQGNGLVERSNQSILQRFQTH